MRIGSGFPAAILLLAGFSLAVTAAWRFKADWDAALVSYRSGAWATGQLETEFAKFERDAARLWAGAPGMNAETFALRLDILLSRVPVVLEGEEGKAVRAIPGAFERLTSILAALPSVQAAASALVPGNPGSLAALEDALAGMRADVYGLSRHMLLLEGFKASHAQATDAFRDAFLVLVAALAAGLGALALLLRQVGLARRARAEAEASRTLLLDALEALSEGILLLDRDERVILANESWRRMYPRVAELARRGTPFERIVEAGQIRGQWPGADGLGRMPGGPGEPFAELELETGEGRTILLGRTRTRSGIVVCRSLDVTAQRKGERDRARLRDQFHHAQRLESIGRLASGIAHDFNNVLAVIASYADFLVEDLADRPPQRDFARQIQAAADRAAGIVRQILASARASGDESVVDAAVAVTEVGDMLRATLPPDIALEIDAAGPLPIRGDATRISQMLLNLAVNARDAIGAKPGTIRLRAGRADPEDHAAPPAASIRPGWTRIAMGCPPQGRCVRIQVEDNGTGMSEQTVRRIFEPFFTTKDAGSGTGLGLSAALGILEAHGGSIRVSTRLGAGSTFEILWPLAEDAAACAAAGSLDLPRGQGERVLVVDDEPVVAAGLALALRRLGYDAVRYDQPTAALEMLKASPGGLDLVLTDHQMPVMSGLDLALSIRDVRPDLPVLLCSGAARDFDEAEAAGAEAVLRKPVRLEVLAGAVRDAIDRTRHGANSQRRPRGHPGQA